MLPAARSRLVIKRRARMKRIFSLVLAIGLALAPITGLAAPKKGVTTKNLVSRYESALKFLGTAVPIENKKLALEFVKREDIRKEFSSKGDADWKIIGITFPSSDMIEDVLFWFTGPVGEYARYEHTAYLSAVSSKGSAAKRLDDANRMIWDMNFKSDMTFNEEAFQDGVGKIERSNYVFSIWELGGVTYYRLKHTQSELGEEWRKQHGILQPIELPADEEAPSEDDNAYLLRPGYYIVGTDIPEGSYRVESVESAIIFVYQSKGGPFVTSVILQAGGQEAGNLLILEAGNEVDVAQSDLRLIPFEDTEPAAP